MKVLITGSNGFIGGHVCKYLKEKGVKVGLATSTVRERATGYLKAHHIDRYFDEPKHK